MKKFSIYIFFFLVIILNIRSQGIQELAQKITSNIISFSQSEHQLNCSIIRFKSSSSLSDLELQRFYHLIITPLESSGAIRFRDFLTGFSNSSGNFNMNRINETTFLISIKLINNLGKLGAGVIIYNRNIDRIVSVRYFENFVKQPEVALLGIKDPGVSSAEYIKKFDLKVNHSMLNVDSTMINNTEYIFFLLSERINIYTFKDNSIKKEGSFKIEWGKPYFPAIKNEGNLFIFRENEKVFIVVGSNFSRYSFVLKYEDNKIIKVARLKFSVQDVLKVNGVKYLAGFNYNFGKNYYKGKLYLKKFNISNIRSSETYIKNLPDFYSAAFYKQGSDLRSLFIIDLNYNLRIFSDALNERKGVGPRYGSTHAIMDDYIALSDYSTNNDRLMVLKIGNDLDNPIFMKEIKGEIKIIKRGVINNKKGFWIIIDRRKNGFANLNLQFWRKNID